MRDRPFFPARAAKNGRGRRRGLLNLFTQIIVRLDFVAALAMLGQRGVKERRLPVWDLLKPEEKHCIHPEIHYLNFHPAYPADPLADYPGEMAWILSTG